MKQFGMWSRATSAVRSGASLCLPWLLAALVGGCVPEFDLSGHACSCVPGWECHDNECVPAGTAQIVDAGEPDAGAPDSGEQTGPIVLPCGTAERPNVLFDPTFETTPLSALPSEAEVWGGDAAERVEGEGGVTPSVGEHMLAFRGTAQGPSMFEASQVFQLVPKASAGFSVGDHFVVCASFNRVAGDSNSDTRFGIRVYGYAERLAAFYDAYAQPRHTFDPARTDIWTDADPSTWERTCVEARIDADANYLAVELHAVENIDNDVDGVEFDGHFVDDACLTLLRAQ